MTDRQRPDMQDWEAQVNALLDGELDDAAAEALKARAERDQALARAIVEGYQLQRLVASLPIERAPDSLREKLRRIPAEQESLALAASRREREARSGGRKRRWFVFEPRWAMALAAVPLVIAIGTQLNGSRVGDVPPGTTQLGQREAPTEAELARARQELALAFSYLREASRVTGREIEQTIGAGMRDPVTERTVRTLSEQFDLNEEQDT